MQKKWRYAVWCIFSGRKGNFLMADRQLDMACMAHPKQGKTVITMKNTTCSKGNVTFWWNKSPSILSLVQQRVLIQQKVLLFFVLSKSKVVIFTPQWSGNPIPQREFSTLGLVMNVPDLTSFYNSLYVKIWNEFVSLSEEEQDLVITRRTSSPQEREINRESTEEELVLTERGWSKCC